MQVAGYEAVIDCVRAVSRNISAACSSQRTGNSVKKPCYVKALHRREVPFGNHVLAPPFLSRCAAGQSIQQRP